MYTVGESLYLHKYRPPWSPIQIHNEIPAEVEQELSNSSLHRLVIEPQL